MIVRFRFLFVWAALQLLLSATPALAVQTPWQEDQRLDNARVRLLLDDNFNGEHLTLGLQVALEPGWKTYWRSPGEGGVAPSLDWSASRNIRSLEWLWPTPGRYSIQGLEALGYTNEVIFPLRIEPGDPSKPVYFSGRLTLPICSDICVLADIPLALHFSPQEVKADSAAGEIIAGALHRVPARMESSGGQVRLGWHRESGQLELRWQLANDWRQPQIFVDGAGLLYRKPVVTIDGNRLRALIPVENPLGDAVELEGEKLTVTAIDGDLAIEASLPPDILERAPRPVKPPITLRAFTLLALTAVAGGLILNLMPCVLPVISLKLMSVVEARGRSRTQVRQQFIATAAGIIVSFIALAIMLAAIKMAGGALGWGIQFQNPFFLAFMVAVTGLFAANLLGVFELRLPAAVNGRLASVGGSSQRGHFLQGAVATLLATPCSAPLLGTAVSAALAGGYAMLFALFGLLGVGMALPFLAIAAFPAAVRLLPRPGPWMKWLKILLGLLLLGTSLWLLEMLSDSAGFWRTAIIAGTLLVPILLLFLYRRAGSGKFLAAAVPTALCGAGVALLLAVVMERENLSTPQTEMLPWQPFREESIVGAVSRGEVVLVDITADWCITCKANKIGVLERKPVAELLQRREMLLLQGDWTTPDPRISEYLRRQGRYGVPFNIVYGPDAPEGIPLPVILTPGAVIEALEKAGMEMP